VTPAPQQATTPAGTPATRPAAPGTPVSRAEERPPDAAPFAGTGTLLRFHLRRDRVMVGSWVAVNALFLLMTAAAFADTYQTVADRVPFARTVAGNTGLIALTGKPFDLLTTGGLTAWRIGGFCAALAGIMSYLLVVRHTRAEEETGRLELVGAAAVGRRAPLAAALLVVGVANAVLALVVTVPLAAAGLPVAGSVTLGLGVAAAGCVFGAVAAVTAQLTQTGRAANGLAATVLATAYVLRGIGDSNGPEWLSWVSPLGWAGRVRPYAGERWWVLALSLVLVVVLLGVAFTLNDRRDLGEGVIPTRPGRPEASPALGGSLALAWRLQRGALLGWAVGFAVLGVVYGSIAESAADILRDSPQLSDTLQRLGIDQSTAVDSYLATTLGFSGIVAAAYAVQAVLRLRGEEASGTAEALLTTPLARVRWAAGHLSAALAGSALLVAVMGLMAGVAHGAAIGDVPGESWRMLGAGLGQVPAVWVFAGIGMLLFGLLPQRTALSWAAVVAAFALTWIGPAVRLPQWALDVSPFTHLPSLPVDDATVTPYAWLLAVAAAFAVAGLAALRRRDLPL
jgi:ABC-2 type transport system permease protein